MTVYGGGGKKVNTNYPVKFKIVKIVTKLVGVTFNSLLTRCGAFIYIEGKGRITSIIIEEKGEEENRKITECTARKLTMDARMKGDGQRSGIDGYGGDRCMMETNDWL